MLDKVSPTKMRRSESAYGVQRPSPLSFIAMGVTKRRHASRDQTNAPVWEPRVIFLPRFTDRPFLGINASPQTARAVSIQWQAGLVSCPLLFLLFGRLHVVRRYNVLMPASPSGDLEFGVADREDRI